MISADPGQTARICRQNWIYTNHQGLMMGFLQQRSVTLKFGSLKKLIDHKKWTLIFVHALVFVILLATWSMFAILLVWLHYLYSKYLFDRNIYGTTKFPVGKQCLNLCCIGVDVANVTVISTLHWWCCLFVIINIPIPVCIVLFAHISIENILPLISIYFLVILPTLTLWFSVSLCFCSFCSFGEPKGRM